MNLDNFPENKSFPLIHISRMKLIREEQQQSGELFSVFIRVTPGGYLIFPPPQKNKSVFPWLASKTALKHLCAKHVQVYSVLVTTKPSVASPAWQLFYFRVASTSKWMSMEHLLVQIKKLKLYHSKSSLAWDHVAATEDFSILLLSKGNVMVRICPWHLII